MASGRRSSARPRGRDAARRSPRRGASPTSRVAGMTHAWLFTGPPGSGRSVAARAFAAALQCPRRRLRRVRRLPHRARRHPRRRPRRSCRRGCRSAVGEMRALVLRAGRRAVRRPLAGGADRGRRPADRAGRPTRCSRRSRSRRRARSSCSARRRPHPDDVSVTIRSRCRVVPLRTPPARRSPRCWSRRDGIDPALAALGGGGGAGPRRPGPAAGPRPEARGRPRGGARRARAADRLGACFDAADELVGAAEAEADGAVGRRWTAPRREALKTALGAGGTGKGAAAAARGAAGALKELERRQKSRATRAQRDALDRALVDLAGFYRDVLLAQCRRRRPRPPTRTPPPTSPAGRAAHPPKARCAGSRRCWPAGRRSS